MPTSPTILTSSRHHRQTLGIQPLKPLLQTMNSLSRRTNSQFSKRPLVNDENAEFCKSSISSSPPKRVKSTNPLNSGEAGVSQLKQSSRKALSEKQKNLPLQKRSAKSSGKVLGDITNTQESRIVSVHKHDSANANTSKSQPATSQKKLGRALQQTSSKAHPISPLVPVSSRGRKRARSPEIQIYTDPSPTSKPITTSVTSSIASVLEPSPSVSNREKHPLEIDDCPPQWQFTIYEDSPEESLNNILQHSTNTLEISGEADEIDERGKENIPPERLEELLALEPEARRAAMRLDQEERLVEKKDENERKVLGELDVKTMGYDMDDCVWVYDDEYYEVETPKGEPTFDVYDEEKVEGSEQSPARDLPAIRVEEHE